MQPHQERVIAEKKDLDERLEKLAAFVSGSPVFDQLPTKERLLLIAQRAAMSEYSSILERRILLFTEGQ